MKTETDKVARSKAHYPAEMRTTPKDGLTDFRSESMLAFDEIGGEGFEWGGGFAEGCEGFEGVGYELFGVFEGLVDAVDGGPGGLDAGGVFACGLA